jgi:UDP-2,4-diacetamido-2,4,6-trideoxy-beta-L-altropyranose hydrolase
VKVAFRVDASSRIGTGHFARCRTLAEELQSRGAQVQFICRAHRGHMADVLDYEGIPMSLLPASVEPSEGRHPYGDWLGVSQAQDALETIAVLGGGEIDWLVVDHYALDAEWERRLRPYTSQIMVIDDLANRQHETDVLLDQNYSQTGDDRYRTRIPPGSILLTGPRYSLLRPEYADYRRTSRARTGTVRKVLVFFGGSDNLNMTQRTLEALSTPELCHLEVDVLIGANYRHEKAIRHIASRRPRIRVFGPRPHLADLMAEADLAVGAGGATMWERMCLGLPSLVISIADNQKPACEALASAGFIEYAGAADALSVGQIASAIGVVIGRPDRLQRQSAEGLVLVDGMGTRRVTEVLSPTPKEDLRLRLAHASDALLFFDWVNDPTVRESALRSEPIVLHEHLQWFTQQLKDPTAHLLVMEADGLPVGQIRFNVEGRQAMIDYSLDPSVRGRGWGLRLVELGTSWFYDNCTTVTSIRAVVKRGNVVSSTIFKRLGYEEIMTGSGDTRVFRAYTGDRIESHDQQ